VQGSAFVPCMNFSAKNPPHRQAEKHCKIFKMTRFLFILTVLFTTSCSGQDYSVKDSMKQTLDAERIGYVIIECYCNNGVDVKETQTKTIEIEIKGKLESVGYHGKQETPKKIGQETLSFKTEMKNDTLRIVSKEWTYIHHSYLIERTQNSNS
jgi:hypothetical protein